MVSLQNLYLNVKNELKKADVPNPSFEALCILEHTLHFRGRGYIAVNGELDVAEEITHQCIAMSRERKSRPLQYILGQWEFMGIPYEIGEGVLIPREDTSVLVMAATGFIGKKRMDVLDLCAGSGIIALSIANICPHTFVTAVEFSPAAMGFLQKNIVNICPERVRAVCADITKKTNLTGEYDVIVSNPPYIPANDIEQLDKYVKCEPLLALDGGEKGLDFYHAIVENYIGCLKKGGLLAVEIGMGQEKDVCEIFYSAGLSDVSLEKDLNAINRVVTGTKG